MKLAGTALPQDGHGRAPEGAAGGGAPGAGTVRSSGGATATFGAAEGGTEMVGAIW
jgi:hypothetical protein